MTAVVRQAERAARRFVDSALFLVQTVDVATKAAEVIESSLVSAVGRLSPDEVDEVLRELGDDLAAVLAVLKALEEA